MLTFRKILLLSLLAFFSIACSTNPHSSMAGSVAMKISESKGVACLFGDSPKIGDTLTLFETKCTDGVKSKESTGVNCKMVKSGEATIVRMMNDHYAEFETKLSVPFQEGYMIKLTR